MIEVKDCNNCPFRVEMIESIYESYKYCALDCHLTKKARNIEERNSIPSWCPLKEGNIEIQLEEINK